MISAAVTKKEVVSILEEIGTILEILGENPFKIRAYFNGARVLEGRPEEVQDLVESGELGELKGIGPALVEKITEIVQTGKAQYHEELCKSIPEGLLTILEIPGLGPKKVKALYQQLKIESIRELEQAAKAEKIQNLAGFGAKTEERILKEIEHFKKSEGHFLLSKARTEGEKLVVYLQENCVIDKIEIAGSIRRHNEIVKDIDILVVAKKAKSVHQALVDYANTFNVVAHGETKSSITLVSGINCDLRTVTKKEFPHALYYFTGSKEHNVQMRGLAKKRGYKINEYGLFKGTKSVPCSDEQAIFRKLGFDYIPPELREGQGEIELAAEKALPKLVEPHEIRGVFHVHSTYSDGTASLEDMIQTAEDIGYEYIGISDHSQSAVYANGLTPIRLKKQRKEIEKLQKQFKKIHIFWGIEADILADGRLDYPDDILKEFDFVIGSLHSSFTQPKQQQTDRILRAMDNKYLTYWGHPTGRLLLGREGVQLEMATIIEAAAERGVTIELNANPRRLDLDWRYGRYAKQKGCKVGIHPDAHSIQGLYNTGYGVGAARKGGLEATDVSNTMTLSAMQTFLKKRK